MKMWSGRFRRPLNPEFEQWQRSFPFDKRLLPQEIAASSAHARALAGVGVLSAAELKSLLDALAHVKHACASDPHFLEDSEAEDVHHFLERRLVELAGDVGLKLHAGRSIAGQGLRRRHDGRQRRGWSDGDIWRRGNDRPQTD